MLCRAGRRLRRSGMSWSASFIPSLAQALRAAFSESDPRQSDDRCCLADDFETASAISAASISGMIIVWFSVISATMTKDVIGVCTTPVEIGNHADQRQGAERHIVEKSMQICRDPAPTTATARKGRRECR